MTRPSSSSNAAGQPSNGPRDQPASSLESGSIWGLLLVYLTTTHFLLTGLTINAIQLLLLACSRLLPSERLRPRLATLNAKLHCVLVAPMLAVFYHCFKIRLNVYADEPKVLQEFREPGFTILLTNHTYELDYVIVYSLLDQLGCLESLKLMAKAELRFLPVIGWSLYLSDNVFVRRDWSQDRLSVAGKISGLLSLERTTFGIYAEGTRYTADKYEASLRYASSRRVQSFRHHLVPKARGFILALRQVLREAHRSRLSRPVRIVNMQTLMRTPVDTTGAIRGRRVVADVYCELVDISDRVRREALGASDEAECEDCANIKQLLFDVYKRKDEIVDDYRANGNSFRLGSTPTKLDFRAPTSSLVLWFCSLCYAYGLLAYWGLVAFPGCTLCKSIVVTYFVLCAAVFKRFLSESHVKR